MQRVPHVAVSAVTGHQRLQLGYRARGLQSGLLVTKIVKSVANIKYIKIVPFQLTVLLTLFQVSLSLKTAELVNAAQTCRTAVEPSLDTQTTDN